MKEYWIEIFFGAISLVVGIFIKYLLKQIKQYQTLLEMRENDAIEKTINEKIEPIIHQIKILEDQIKNLSEHHSGDMTQVVSTFGYCLTQLCSEYLKQNYLTQGQYTQLIELYNYYKSLLSRIDYKDGKTEEIVQKTARLPIEHLATKE